MDSKIRSELQTGHVERGSKIVLEALHFLVVLSSNFQLTYFCPSEKDYRVRLSLRTIKVRYVDAISSDPQENEIYRKYCKCG